MTKPNNEFKIECGVPIPPRITGSAKRGMSKYPFAMMKIGDSFHMLCKPGAAASNIVRWRKANGSPFKFITRRVGDGYRVWRIE